MRPAGATSILIIADDLSGAADCAIGTANAGLESIVVFDPAAPARSQVVAVDADSRRLPASEARALNAALGARAADAGCLLYKKIDSTLRGNFAAEMGALTGAGVAIVAPAFPGAGRAVVHGRVRVHGVPLERTAIWASEGMTGTADVAAMLAAQGLRAGRVDLATVRAGLRAELVRLVSQTDVQAVVCDAETDADLAAVAAASAGLPVYWVGSAGLAAHLPGAFGIRGSARAPAISVAGPTLIVVGSASEVSRQQARALEQRRGATLRSMVAPAAVLRAGDADPQWRALGERARSALAGGSDLLVCTGLGEGDDLAQGRAICQSLARLLAPLAPRVGALVATGGETARAVLGAFGASGLRMSSEVEPGVPLSLALGPRPIAVVTKAGAFGSPGTLVAACERIDALGRQTPRT